MGALAITTVAGHATVQDAGRPGHQHEGVPPGGALVPELLAAANAGVSNEPGTAAIEVFGRLTLTARGDVELASDDGERRALHDGDSWTIASTGRRVAYVAVRGGLDVPVVLGGRGTLVAASLGGHDGRALRRMDVLRAGDAPRRDVHSPAAVDLLRPIRVVPGPDAFPPDAFATLVASAFVVDGRSDRTGVRLAGTRLPVPARDPDAPSAPMARGAIQVPPSGEPIVLGPDHPTTGGYPVLAVVVRADLGSLTARPIGMTARFVAWS